MPATQVEARLLPEYLGAVVPGRGKIKKAAVVQPGGDIVVVEFDTNSYREQTYHPSEIVEIEIG